MSRRGSAPTRTILPDPKLRQRAAREVHQHGDGERQEVRRREDRVRRHRSHRREDRQAGRAVDRAAVEGARQRDARGRSEVASRRRRHLPGAGRSALRAPPDAGDALGDRSARKRAREVDGARSPPSCWTPRRTAAPPSRSAKTRTAWRKRTRRSRTTAGKTDTRLRSDAMRGTRDEDHSGTYDSHRALPQHRHHGPHRCRQDDDDRAHPVLHRRLAQDRRSARRRRRHGLDGAGAGARHHDHVRCDDLLLEGHGQALPRAPHQHHRHPRPRRLHDRSRA